MIVGRCTDKRLITKINQLLKDTQRICVVEFVKNPYPLFRMSDCILVCSKNEAFGRTILEGMLLKKPVIASNGGGVPEIIKDNVNGMLYNSGNFRELAQKILILAKNKQLREKIAKTGYRTAITRFSDRRYSGEFMKIVRRVLA